MPKKVRKSNWALDHINEFTLLVAVALSAQSTDKKVNEVTKDLFIVAPIAEKMYKLGEKKIYNYIKKLGLGQLPGDIMFKSGNSTFFFPIVTCIIISIVLTIIFNLFK